MKMFIFFFQFLKSIFRFEGPNRLVNEQRDKKTGKLQCICIREVNEDKEKLTEVKLFYVFLFKFQIKNLIF